MSRVFGGSGALGSLVTGRLNNLTPEWLAINWYNGVLSAVVTRKCTSLRVKSHE